MVLGMTGDEICLLTAHEVWAEQYALEKARIIEAIGAYVLDIQHVGSTSISSVPAKPIIDILIGVEDFEGASVCIVPMEGIGYVYRGEYGIPHRHYFVKGDPRTHHVHMVEKDSENWRITVLFRDLLRSHPDVAREYAEAKVRLAEQYREDRASYQRAKDKVVEGILDKAPKNSLEAT